MPELFATPLSHFARKVRIVLAELEVPFELTFVKDLLSSDPKDFGGNPILRIPTFVDGDRWIVESDQIVRYLAAKHDPEDRLACHSLTPEQGNILAMINAAMGAEVEIILSARSGIEDVESIAYFQRYFKVIRHCLAWLDERAEGDWTGTEFSVLDIALICMWDHLTYYDTLPELGHFTWIQSRVAKFADRASVFESAPARQLA